jgi:hypothetical protein
METFKGKIRLVVKNNPTNTGTIPRQAEASGSCRSGNTEMHDPFQELPKLDRNSLINARISLTSRNSPTVR